MAMRDEFTEGLHAEYFWYPEGGDTVAVLHNQRGETFTIPFSAIPSLRDAAGRLGIRARTLRSEQRAQVNHPRDLGLIEASPLRWIVPGSDPTAFGAPFLRWNGQADCWETHINGLTDFLPARLTADWDDAAGISDMIGFLDPDALITEAALAYPDTVSAASLQHRRDNLIRQANTDFAGVKVNLALVKRTLASSQLDGRGHRGGRFIVDALHLPRSPQTKAPLAIVGLPRWPRRWTSGAPEDHNAMARRVTDALSGIGYHHIATTNANGHCRAEVYIPADAALAGPYLEPITHLAGQHASQRTWGSPV